MEPTIQEVIQKIINAIPSSPFEDTVDTVKVGDPCQRVTRIVTTFLASYEVIQKAVELGANLIITHEPIFYNHRDEVGWLAEDPVFRAKCLLLEEHDIVVWRFHDYWHAFRPDGINTGVVWALGWEAYQDPVKSNLFNLTATPLLDLALRLKDRLGVKTLRMIGDPAMVCQKVGFLPGAWGGQQHILTLSQEPIDTLIVGEIAEWETSEYVRDAQALGMKKALIVTGHQPSEEPGMEYLVRWLKTLFPELSITHIPTGSLFLWV